MVGAGYRIDVAAHGHPTRHHWPSSTHGESGAAPLTIKTHWSVIKAFFGWLFEEDVLTVSPIAKASVSADAVLDRVRDIVVPDFRFIDMLSASLGTGQDRVIFELLFGTGGVAQRWRE